jgi:putative ABC transport system permease protein
MIKNYIKLAFKVLQRNKFFSFVSLFGISFTLMILIILSAFYDSSFGPYGPEKKQSKLLFIPGAKFFKADGGTKIMGSLSYYFIKQTALQMKTPKMIGVASVFSQTVCYSGNNKIDTYKKYSDANYWKIFEYDFLSGRPFNDKECENAQQVAVISKELASKYFGSTDCISKEINVEGKLYVVIGVVENTTISKVFSFSHIFLPYTTSGEDFRVPKTSGSYVVLLLANNKSDFNEMRAEYQKYVAAFQFPNPKRVDTVRTYADTYIEGFSRMAFGVNDKTNIGIVKTVVSILLLLFMLFPALNLVNINISRMVERASEIGIRKSFGASKKIIVVQFLIENIIITLLGGVIGIVLAITSIIIINSSGIIPDLILSVNFPLFIYALIITLIFGIISGVLPAFRMSRLQIVNALKIQEQ